VRWIAHHSATQSKQEARASDNQVVNNRAPMECVSVRWPEMGDGRLVAWRQWPAGGPNRVNGRRGRRRAEDDGGIRLVGAVGDAVEVDRRWEWRLGRGRRSALARRFVPAKQTKQQKKKWINLPSMSVIPSARGV
jgi:hypothetical protein